MPTPEDEYAGNETWVEPAAPATQPTPWLLYALIAIGLYFLWED